MPGATVRRSARVRRLVSVESVRRARTAVLPPWTRARRRPPVVRECTPARARSARWAANDALGRRAAREAGAEPRAHRRDGRVRPGPARLARFRFLWPAATARR